MVNSLKMNEEVLKEPSYTVESSKDPWKFLSLEILLGEIINAIINCIRFCFFFLAKVSGMVHGHFYSPMPLRFCSA